MEIYKFGQIQNGRANVGTFENFIAIHLRPPPDFETGSPKSPLDNANDNDLSKYSGGSLKNVLNKILERNLL